MNTVRGSAVELARAVVQGVDAWSRRGSGAGVPGEVVIFPPFPWLVPVAEVTAGTGVGLGAQDLSPEPCGAFTGQISAEMILDAGASWVIIGHSERRRGLGESPQLCGEKLQMAVEAGLRSVLCVGESWEERQEGRTDEINRGQLEAALRHVTADALERIVIAYEPVWAIGTGRTATVEDAQAAHRAIRGLLASLYAPASAERMRILYGGSVNAGNARSLFSASEVDGGLIGGASLKPAEFLSIVAATGAATASSTA